MTHYLVSISDDGSFTVASECDPLRVVSLPWRVVTASELETLRDQYEKHPVPASISARQIRLWLVRAGYSLDMIAQVIASIPDPATRDTVAIEWEYAPVVERSHPWLAPLGQALGLDDASIDQAFREAATL